MKPRQKFHSGLRPAAGAVVLLYASAFGQQPRSAKMYVPPPQHAVTAVIADGVLLVEGSVSPDSTASKAARPQLFVLDTAATSTIVHSSIGNTGQLKDQKLRLAGAEINPLTALLFSLTPWSEQTGQPVAGIAGSDIFQHFDVRIDYVHQLVTLVAPQSCAVPWPRIPLHMIGGLPFLDAELQTASGKKLRGLFLLDTGQSGSGMVLTSEFVAAHPELLGKQSPAEMPTLDTSGTLRSASVVRVPTLQLGNHTLQGVVATIAPPAAGGAGAKLAGVIGGGILSRFDVVIDLPRGWLTLTPNAYYAAPFEADMSGMLVVTTRIAGQAGEPSGEVVYTVAGISKNSPAADSGLQIGDRLIEVAGQRVKDMSLDLVRKALMSGPGKKLLLTIDRSGMKIKLTLTLQRAV